MIKIIKVNNLTKSFDKKCVLKNLSLEVNDGEIVALVGKNGAGKSTLIRTVSGILSPDSGTVQIEPESKIGILMGGDVNLYKNLTPYEIIRYFGKLHDMKPDEIHSRIDELDRILNIKSFLNTYSHKLSRGMKQKVGLAVSIIHKPDVMLLDEPSTGLDVEAANDVLNFIKCLKSDKKTILIATHNLFEIFELSDSIAFLRDGKITSKVPVTELSQNRSDEEKSNLIVRLLRDGEPK